jgi:creatinine amidohydrolase
MSNQFAKMTWPEINQAALEEKVAIIPAGTLEDHGLHLPIDTDVVIANEISTKLAAALPDSTILLPPIIFGYSPHHLDGPGTVTLR